MGAWSRRRARSDENRSALPGGIAALYETHSEDLLYWLQARTYSAQVAADLCAETFAVALENAASYDPERGDHGAWLWGIARNLLRRYHRSAAVDARARARLQVRTFVVADDDLDLVNARIDAAVAAERIREALDDLSPKLAAAVRARVVEEKSYAEIAEECDCTEAAARVRVSRGLAQLLASDDLAGFVDTTETTEASP